MSTAAAATGEARTRTTPVSDRSVSLDDQIINLELEIVARDGRIRSQARRTSAQLRSHAAWLGIAAAAGMSLLAWRALRQPRFAPPSSAVDDDAGEQPRRSGGMRIPLMLLNQLLPIVWPMLPLGVQSKVSPARASMIASIALPVLASLTQRAPSAARPAAALDLSRFCGTWYELAHLPSPLSATDTDVRMSCAWHDGEVGVTEEHVDADGVLQVNQGALRLVAPNDSPARLEKTQAPGWLRWLPWVWREWWVLSIDDDYRHALLGTPDMTRLRLLARSPRSGAAPVERLLAEALQQGYDTSKLRVTPHQS